MKINKKLVAELSAKCPGVSQADVEIVVEAICMLVAPALANAFAKLVNAMMSLNFEALKRMASAVSEEEP